MEGSAVAPSCTIDLPGEGWLKVYIGFSKVFYFLKEGSKKELAG